jgi:hypothetical protein
MHQHHLDTVDGTPTPRSCNHGITPLPAHYGAHAQAGTTSTHSASICLRITSQAGGHRLQKPCTTSTLPCSAGAAVALRSLPPHMPAPRCKPAAPLLPQATTSPLSHQRIVSKVYHATPQPVQPAGAPQADAKAMPNNTAGNTHPSFTDAATTRRHQDSNHDSKQLHAGHSGTDNTARQRSGCLQ